MRDIQNFLYAKSFKEWFCFLVNFAKFLRTPSLQYISGQLFLSRFKCKLKFWLQSKWIYTPLSWPLWHLSFKPLHLKQHHCNNTWEFKFYNRWAVIIYCSLHVKIDCSFVKLVMNGTWVRAFTWRWVVGKMKYFQKLDWFPRKKILVNNLEKARCFRKQEMGFSQSCVCTVFIVIKIPDSLI